MKTESLYEQLEVLLKTLVLDSVSATLKRRPRLAGFALCTDSDLSTLFSVATELPKTERNWYNPNAWKIDPVHHSRLDLPSKLMAKAAGLSTDPDRHAQAAWSILERALAGARALSPKLLLLVVDTDPGPQTNKAMRKSAQRLNPRSLYRSWMDAQRTPNLAQLEYLLSMGIGPLKEFEKYYRMIPKSKIAAQKKNRKAKSTRANP
jgi:hypothetical protein